jgi:hypothetical protein
MSKKKPIPRGHSKKQAEVSLVRSSAAEYLTFVAASGVGGVEAVYADENVWLSQKMMGLLYDVETHTINYHLKTVFADRELQEDSVIRNFRITAADGKSYDTGHYNLSAIIAAPSASPTGKCRVPKCECRTAFSPFRHSKFAFFDFAYFPGRLFYSAQILVCLSFGGKNIQLDSANDARFFAGTTDLNLAA